MENKEKIGLVMEGGAMRGMFTCGVIDVMMEHGITPDGAIGVSAGATFGCNIKSHQIGRALRYNVRYARDWRYSSILSFLVTGDIYGAKFDYDVIPNKLDLWDYDTFASSPMEFYVVATDCDTGRAAYHRCTDSRRHDINWIRASASMPMVSRPVRIGSRVFLDGGISDSIPLKYFEHKGYRKNIVILTQPQGYFKKPLSGNYINLLKAGLRKYPAIQTAMTNRHKMYNAELEYVANAEDKGNALVIRPKEALNIPSICHDPYKKVRVYLHGREVALERLEEMKRFMV